MPLAAAVASGRSVGVPGVLRMLEAAHRRHGRAEWAKLFEPAIRLAESGFPMSPRLHRLPLGRLWRELEERAEVVRHFRRLLQPLRDVPGMCGVVDGGILAGYGSVAYNITQVSFRQAICPPRLQGRMNSVIRFLVWGTMPLGLLLGGALATWIGLRNAIWVGAIGALFTFLPILLSPVLSIEKMPAPLEEPVPDEALGPLVAAPEPHA